MIAVTTSIMLRNAREEDYPSRVYHRRPNRNQYGSPFSEALRNRPVSNSTKAVVSWHSEIGDFNEEDIELDEFFNINSDYIDRDYVRDQINEFRIKNSWVWPEYHWVSQNLVLLILIPMIIFAILFFYLILVLATSMDNRIKAILLTAVSIGMVFCLNGLLSLKDYLIDKRLKDRGMRFKSFFKGLNNPESQVRWDAGPLGAYIIIRSLHQITKLKTSAELNRIDTVFSTSKQYLLQNGDSFIRESESVQIDLDLSREKMFIDELFGGRKSSQMIEYNETTQDEIFQDNETNREESDSSTSEEDYNNYL